MGANGKLYEIDFSAKLVAHIQDRAIHLATNKQLVAPVEVKQNNHRTIGLGRGKGTIDTIFCVDTYHHLEFFEEILADMYNALTSNGRLVRTTADSSSSFWF
jgi:2-polyprenyl-3-methyl-5-hydroxy-6-metoxy-1,4-benzoquinol methylase